MSHFPAHESIEEYAERFNMTVVDAYAYWSDRSYPETPRSVTKENPEGGTWPARGSGLTLLIKDLP